MDIKLSWEDAEDIGIELYEAHPDIDPLTLSFPKLHQMIVALDTFDDDPSGSSEGKLEAIQMAWLEEIRENS